MPKSYRRRSYRGSRDKYSVEQSAGALTIPGAQQAYTQVVPDSAIGGMRKVKHLTVSIATPGAVSLTWAIVYVPQGTTVNPLNMTGGSLYEPNQYVMNCGAAMAQGGPLRFTSPLSRNLNSGDKIYLIIANNDGSDRVINYVVRYAITLQ